LQYAVLGLFISSVAGSTDSALRMTYGLVVVLALLTLGPYQVVQGRPPGFVLSLATWLRSVSPLPAVMEVRATAGLADTG
jgi:hypothetical protein